MPSQKPDEIIDELKKVSEETEAHQQALLELARRRIDLIKELTNQGFTVRQIGEMTGISFQRVHQMLQADAYRKLVTK